LKRRRRIRRDRGHALKEKRHREKVRSYGWIEEGEGNIH